jgi:hypothetical protein
MGLVSFWPKAASPIFSRRLISSTMTALCDAERFNHLGIQLRFLGRSIAPAVSSPTKLGA